MEVVLRVLRGPLVLGHVRALAGEIVRVTVTIARQVLAERPGWVEVIEDHDHVLFLGPPVPADELAAPEVQALIGRAPDASVVLTADPARAHAEPVAEPPTVEPPAVTERKGGRK